MVTMDMAGLTKQNCRVPCLQNLQMRCGINRRYFLKLEQYNIYKKINLKLILKDFYQKTETDGSQISFLPLESCSKLHLSDIPEKRDIVAVAGQTAGTVGVASCNGLSPDLRHDVTLPSYN